MRDGTTIYYTTRDDKCGIKVRLFMGTNSIYDDLKMNESILHSAERLYAVGPKSDIFNALSYYYSYCVDESLELIVEHLNTTEMPG